MPECPIKWPTYFIDVFLNSDFDGFMVRFASCNRVSTSCNLSSCSASVRPNTRISSVWHNTPSIDSTSWVILFWKYSLLLDRPMTRRLNANLPNGVMKVVSNLLSSDRRVCQNPRFKSILLNHFAPARRPKLWSILGNGKFSRLTLSLRRDKSTQILILPLGLGTTTIPAHQSVGWSTRKITPVFFHVFELLLHLRKQRNRDSTKNWKRIRFRSFFKRDVVLPTHFT